MVAIRSNSRKSAARNASTKKAPRKAARKQTAHAGTGRRWSQQVTETSNALDLESSVFKKPPKELARSLKRSAESSTRKKSSPYRSAMSMLTFYENRAGHNLSAADRKRLESAKDELRKAFGRE